MNPQLTESIVYHILANLGVLPSSFVHQETTKSLLDKSFLLSEKVVFQIEDEEKPLHNNIYGCQVSIADKEFKMLLADCTTEKNIPEYVLVVQLKDAPIYGVFYCPSEESLIAVNTDKKHFIPCTIYLQATFLAGMEQLRDVGFGWKKASDYKEIYAQLLSMIKFHSTFFAFNDPINQKDQGETK